MNLRSCVRLLCIGLVAGLVGAGCKTTAPDAIGLDSGFAAKKIVGSVDEKWRGPVEATVSSGMIDQASVQYRYDFTSIDPSGNFAVCGAFNAKNRMGGYVGMTRFAVIFVNEAPYQLSIQGDDKGAVWNKYPWAEWCGPVHPDDWTRSVADPNFRPVKRADS
ncbi:hypothetical protein [Niveispirillum sp. KHB5.9]|uniref:hypothetical protein n=1 Tax=Niveispirillum sp. KHB5.9 TaxID=3400269 RepID=UPI003A852740